MTLQRDELEKFVLGAILSNNGKELLAPRLITDDFTKAEYKELFIMALKRLAEGQSVSYESISVDSSLSAEAAVAITTLAYGSWTEAEAIDVEKAINDLILVSDNTFAAEMLDKTVKAIKSKMNIQPDKIMANVTAITSVLMGRHKVTSDMPIDAAVTKALDLALQRQSQGRLMFGYNEIDTFTSGLRRGEVIVIGARTNVGKSMLCLHPALVNAREGNKVLLCLNEMDSEEMSLRMLSKISKTDISVLSGDREPSTVDVEAIEVGREELRRLNIYFSDKVKTVGAIEASLAMHKAIGSPVDLMILDHFNKLKDDSGKNRKSYDFMTDAFQQIYEMAKKYNCTFIVMTQINRAGALAEKVTLEHLKGTGSLEEDPDKVFLMYGDKGDPDGRVLYLAKNRFGKKDQEFYLRMKGHIMTLE